MKQIVMTTVTEETVKMDGVGQFKTGVSVLVEDDGLADSLLSRQNPQFREATETDFDTPAPPDKKKATK